MCVYLYMRVCVCIYVYICIYIYIYIYSCSIALSFAPTPAAANLLIQDLSRLSTDQSRILNRKTTVLFVIISLVYHYLYYIHCFVFICILYIIVLHTNCFMSPRSTTTTTTTTTTSSKMEKVLLRWAILFEGEGLRSSGSNIEEFPFSIFEDRRSQNLDHGRRRRSKM